MRVEFGGIGLLPSVEDDLAVRLIGDQENGVAEPGRHLLHHCGQAAESLLCIDRSRGVVGCIDQDRCCLLIEGGLRGLEIDLEIIRFHRDHTDFGACASDVLVIFRKIRSEYNDFLSGFCHAADGVGDGSRGTRCGEDQIPVIRHSEAGVQGSCDSFLDPGVALRGIVAVKLQRFLLLKKPDRGIPVAVRCRHRGIPETEVKYVVITDFFSARVRVLRQLTDHGLVFKHGKVFPIDHCVYLLYFNLKILHRLH